MRSALSMNLFVRYPLEEALEKVRAIGYGYVELFDYLTREEGFELKRLKSLLSRAGLRVCSVSTVSVKLPLINDYFAGPDEDRRKAAVGNMKRAARFARQLGCDLVTTELTGNVANVGQVDQQVSRSCFLKSVDEVMPTLEKEGASISFEPHPADFIEDSNPAADLLRSIGSRRVGYLWCASHSFVLGGEPVELIRYAADVLNFVYISDTHDRKRMMAPTLRPDVRVHEHVTPGEGNVDFGSQFKTLKEVGYEGFVCAQPFSYTDDAPEEAAAETKKFLDKMLARHAGVRS